jgi:hypothetical protein
VNSNKEQNSNLAFEEIFSDNYTTDGPTLLSRGQKKLLSQQRTKSKKDTNEKK